ncbi:MAG: glycosyltransferase family 4 protein [Donghicola eburneus]|nr:glycosyltransferase family 1 protein [Donghicola eburneus]MCI5038837.1 glycosyltransferase family 4 protein [Donghicola eburneus]
MRKLLINGRFLSGGETAVNAVARELSSALHRQSIAHPNGWQVELVVPQALLSKAEATGIPSRAHGRRSGIIWEQTELPSLRYDGVILSLFNTVPVFGRGYVTMLHDAHVMTSPDSYSRPTRIWREFLSRRAGATGNYVLTPSEHSKVSLLEHGIGRAEHYGIVPNGPGNVGRVQGDRAIFERLSFNEETPFCVGLSSLLPHKNIGDLLSAFARPELANIQLVLFGKASRADFVAAGHDVPDNVHFPGFVSDEELAALYDKALAVCVPSLEEGFGMPALEGMARGAIAVVSPCGALPEVVGAAGLFAKVGQPDQIVAHISRINTDPAYAKGLRAKGLARARAFTWEIAAEKAFAHLEAWGLTE